MNAMEHKKLRTNASGYYDEPCYRAVTGAQAEKVAFYKEMYMTMFDKVMAMAVKGAMA